MDSLKYICFLLFLELFITPVFSQMNFDKVKLGIYCKVNNPYGSSECLTLNANSNFEFLSEIDTGKENYGKGHYSIEKDKLILRYETKPLKIGWHYQEIWQKNPDSLIIKFQVYDLDDNPVPNTNILFKDAQGNYIKDHGLIVDQKGSAQIIFTRNKPKEAIISNIGFKEHHIPLDTVYNSQFTVYLQHGGLGIPISTRIDTLKIKNWSDQSFMVETKDGKTDIWKKIGD